MIKRLLIENFKSIKHLELECGRVNVLIGEPNTGKSNILEALGLFSFMAFRGRFQDYVRMREPHELFHNYVVREPIRITLDEHVIVGRFDEQRETVSFSEEGSTSPIMTIDKSGIRLGGLYPSISASVRFYRFKPNVVFRSSDRPFLLPPDGSNLPSVLLFNPSLRSLVTSILEGFSQKPIIDPRKSFFGVAWELEGLLQVLPYELISDTLKRLIFYLAAVESNEGAVIAMEEPEAHAFPAYTKFLAERIALDEGNQYFITTHNPYLLLSLVEKTPKENLAVFVTYLKGYETGAVRLSDEDLDKLVNLASAVFFNLDLFLKRLAEAPGP